MKYNSILPLSALLAITVIGLLVNYNIIPPGEEILKSLEGKFTDSFYIIVFLVILLESIVYIGFYFPGQFFAVVLVVTSKPQAEDIVYLTLAMVAAATVGSVINYSLGKYSKGQKQSEQNNDEEEQSQKSNIKLSRLLLAMIHINSLAFFMFSQGANNKSIKVVGLAGLLNLPYYLALIAATAVLSEEVMAMAENTYFLFSVISIWLVAALYFDIKKRKSEKSELSRT